MQLIKHYIVLTFLTLAFYPAFSQPYKACFSAVKTRACAPFTVNLIDCSGTSDIAGHPDPFYDYTGNGDFITDTFYTYSSPGLYTITQVVNDGISGYDDTTIVNYIEVLPSLSPEFSVGLCRNSQVVLTIEEDTYEEYIIDFGDGTIDTISSLASLLHTYPDNTSRSITVTGNYNPGGCGGTSSKSITPYTDLIPPDLLGLNPGTGGTFELDFNAVPHQTYIIEADHGGGFVPTDTLTDFSGGTYNTSVTNETGGVCFRIRTIDACNNFLVSPEICTISLTVTAENERNILNWISDPSYFSSFRIIRDGNILQTLSASSYIDSSVVCGKNYCYTIQGVLPATNATGGEIASMSLEKCATSVSSVTPPSVTITEVTFTGNTLNISWQKPESAVKEYEVKRYIGGTEYETVKTISTNFQRTGSMDNSCFTVRYVDSCGNMSPKTSLLCPVYLEVNSGEALNELSWTDFSGSFTPSTYTVEILNAENSVTESFITGNSTLYSDPIDHADGNIRYRIKAEGPGGVVSYSNTVFIAYEVQIFVPSVFTPNYDGHNDIFLPKGKFISTFRMVILNRWGEHVFVSTDPDQGWNGTFEGYPAPEGAYGVLIEVSDKNGESRKVSGTVTLVR